MSETQKSYRQILKSTSLFGGVQIVNIVAAVLRSKFAAIFLGPSGVGIFGVLNSTLKLITGVTKLGLDSSSIKEIAHLNNLQDKSQVVKTVNITRNLLWYTGLLGTITTLVLSPLLSEIAFNTKEYTFSFVWISIAVLFMQLTVGDLAILQGLRMLKKLAIVNVYSSVLSVIVAVPMYYFFGIKGIVPTIILTAFFAFLIARFFSKKLNIEREKQSIKTLFHEGKPMLKLGATLSLGSMVTLLTAYVIQVYITNTGGLKEAGFYNAGIIIINSYVGLIFEAMAKDYFPRLSSVTNKIKEVGLLVSQQAMVGVLLLTPVVILFLTFSEYIISILYSIEFLPILIFVNLAMVGTVFKVVSWSMGYVIIAKGDSKVFLKTAIGFNFLLLIFNVIAYKNYGLLGLGVSYVIYYFIHLVVIFLVIKIRYRVSLELDFLKIYFMCLIFVFSTLFVYHIENNLIKNSILVVLILGSSVFTIYNLNKRLDLKSILKR